MFRIYARAQHIIYAGHRGENLARCICFDLTDMQTEFGIGTWNVVFQRPGEALPYIVQNTEEVETYAVWGLDNVDTAIAGEGRCELRYYVNDVLCKTVVFPTVITASLGATGDVPDPYEDIIEKINEAIAAGEIATEAAGNAAQSASDAHDDAQTASGSAAAAMAAMQDLAPEYDATKTYAVGDYVLKSGVLYRCNTAITTAEAWTPAHWTQASLTGDVTDLKSQIDALGLSVVDGAINITYTV